MNLLQLGRLKQRLKWLRLSKSERRHALVGPPHLWKAKRDFQIKFLTGSNLEPEHYLLDIGCGTLRGGIPLISYLEKGHYFGIEARKEVLNEGRKELKEAGLEWKCPTLLFMPDIAQAHLPRKFDFIWAFSVLIHMADDILNATLGFVSEHLSNTGVFYANIHIGEKDGKWQGFPKVWRSFEFYNEACSRSGLTVSDLGPLKNYGHISNAADPDCQRMLKIQFVES
jgi:SAM-dependent methyltransferase